MAEQETDKLLKNNLNKDFVYNFFITNKLDEYILEKYIGYFDEFYQFERIVSNEVPEDWWIEFIEKEADIYLLWCLISVYQILSKSFLEKHSNKLIWDLISEYQNLSEDFIERHANKVDWVGISSRQKLSEPFIEKNCDKVDWYMISKHQKLSESFIERHSEEVDWNSISSFQKLSEEFINFIISEIIRRIY